ncbi:UPF0111 protein CPn_0681/CP_0066/CPj0681/CpB0708 [Chlamydiales bacterium SCGC AG-110-P3]|nr:UPF0111 protein CPn_0681/CP_0066/CPj0681/CpB0708 [Chlamydiales bacterium SCGC AG-110-P3]
MSKSIQGFKLKGNEDHYMLNIAKLFGRSPFAPLQKHMDKVGECVRTLPPLFDAIRDKDYERVDKLAAEISETEHAADLIKNDIRNHLPKGLFLSINRASLLEILSLQDGIADSAEDVAVLTTLKHLEFYPQFNEVFPQFLSRHLRVFETTSRVMQELDELLETSFGGIEAEKVRSLVQEVAFQEHEADVVQRQLLKVIFQDDKGMPYTSFYLWQQIFRKIASISDVSEKLAFRMRMTLEL